MARAGLTDESVIEAGIAADLSANPQLLPEPSIWFQDFNFGETMWDAAYGNVDGGSVSGVGEAVADIAINNVLELEEKRRKEDDPAKDAGMITELAQRQREEAVRYSNGTYYLAGMSISEVEMDEALAMTRDNLDEIARRNNWTDAQRARAEQVLDRAENTTGNERAEILSDADNSLPGLTDAIGENALEIQSRGTSPQLSTTETRDANSEQIEDRASYIEARQSSAIQNGYNASEAIEYAETAVNIRSGVSNAGNPFESSYSPSPEFNVQALGQIEVAETTPAQPAPTETIPTLSQG